MRFFELDNVIKDLESWLKKPLENNVVVFPFDGINLSVFKNAEGEAIFTFRDENEVPYIIAVPFIDSDYDLSLDYIKAIKFLNSQLRKRKIDSQILKKDQLKKDQWIDR